MKKKGTNKGEYGYRTSHRKMQIGMVAFGAAAILVQLAARSLTDSQAAKNILTVMAILSVLPTANIASPLLAAWRYKTPSEQFYSRIRPFEERCVLLYDLIITSKESIMPMDAVAVHPTGIYCYCTSAKIDEKKNETFLKEIFANHRLTLPIKIIKDETAFIHRLESLKPLSEYEDDGSLEYSGNLLKSLSM